MFNYGLLKFFAYTVLRDRVKDVGVYSLYKKTFWKNMTVLLKH